MGLDQYSWSAAHIVLPRAVLSTLELQDQTLSKSRKVDTHKMNSKGLKTVLNNHATQKKPIQNNKKNPIAPEAQKWIPLFLLLLPLLHEMWGRGGVEGQELCTGKSYD